MSWLQPTLEVGPPNWVSVCQPTWGMLAGLEREIEEESRGTV